MKKLFGLNNKKGFTLVELVVVIAILAVLAAIAIPAVIGIISSAGESQATTDASTIDHACKTYYSGLVGGYINSDNFTPVYSGDNVPAVNASVSTKKTMARLCTVAGAMEYSGIYDRLIGRVSDFGYDKDGNIHSVYDQAFSSSDLTILPADAKVSFGTLGYAWTTT